VLATAAVALATHSNISIAAHDSDGPNARLNGSVKSSDKACEDNVIVTIYRDKPQGGSHFNDAGSDRTNGNGKWSIHFDGRIPQGTYYATSGVDPCPLAKTTRIKID
jgi:hypothetical protein